MKCFLKISLALLFYLYAPCVYCQTSRFFSSDHLSSTMISSACIAQDSEGYLWIGTEYGLNRYDGYRFTCYLNDPENPASLGYNLVSTLLCEDTGSIWVGTAKGLDLYNSDTNTFVHFKFPDGLQPRVSKILRLASGRLLVGTAGYGLYQADEDKQGLLRVQNYTSADDDEFYSSLFEDSQGNLWKCDAVNGITFNKLFSGSNAHRFKSPLGTPMSFAEKNGEVLILCLHGMLVYENGELKTYSFESLDRLSAERPVNVAAPEK